MSGSANPTIGIALKIASIFAFLIMSALVKLASRDMPIGELMFSARSLRSSPSHFGYGGMMNYAARLKQRV